MKIYNSLTSKKEKFVPIEEGKVKIYACGPTVYNYFHIGNARPFITFDVLRKYFEYKGYEVQFVQNFTDIDDKIIRKAAEENVSFSDISEKYIKEYFHDAKNLGISPATVHPRATENIDAIIDMVEKLIEKGYAYEKNGDVYFRTKKFDEYGKLSHQPLDDLESGARVDVNDIKEEPMDFAVWKAAKEGEPAWQSPFGLGRPGWHIECSVMANRYLGKTIDIHCGGKDLIFPHHENEIAQSECANGAPFANYWMHNGFINVDNQKMSKSLNNFFTVRDAAQAYGYDTIRFFMLSSHYRSPINYSADILAQSKNALERIYNCFESISFALNGAAVGECDNEDAKLFITRFIAAMDDDLNTADAISVIFDLVKEINILIANKQSESQVSSMASVLYELCGVLGIEVPKAKDIDSEVEELIEQRQSARANKDYKKADEIRDKLKEMNIVLEDTAGGVKWKKV